MDRYCLLVQSYSEAVNKLRDLQGAEFERARQGLSQARLAAQDARIALERHERNHDCLGRASPVDRPSA